MNDTIKNDVIKKGKCNNRANCSNAYLDIILTLGVSDSFVCPECGNALISITPSFMDKLMDIIQENSKVIGVISLVAISIIIFFAVYEPKIKFANRAPDTISEDSQYKYKVKIKYAKEKADIQVLEIPSWLKYNKKDSLFYGTPYNNHVGTHTIKLIAVDSVGDTAKQLVEINVVNTNDPPDLDIKFPDGLSNNQYEHTPKLKDDDQDAEVYISQYKLPEWLSFDEDKNLFFGIPDINDIGLDTLDLIISDNIVTVEKQVIINILKENMRPKITSEPLLSTDEDMPYKYVIKSEDEDGDHLTTTVNNLPDWLSFSSRKNRIYGIPENKDVGKYNIEVIVSDNITEPVVFNYDLEVINVNDSPEFDKSQTNKISIEEGEPFEYYIKASDPDKSDSIEKIEILEKPDWVNFDNEKLYLSGNAPEEGKRSHTIIIVATDSYGASSEFKLRIQISLDQEKLLIISFTPVKFLAIDNDQEYKNIESLMELTSQVADFGMENEFFEKFGIGEGKTKTVYLVDPEDIEESGRTYKGSKCIKLKSNSKTISIEDISNFEINKLRGGLIFVVP